MRITHPSVEIAGYGKVLEADLAWPGTTVDSQTFRHRAQVERQIQEARDKMKQMANAPPR